MIPNVLSVAGTDPSGGAGIQADLKAFSANGAYGMSVITALVAQTTTGVTAVREVAPEFVTAQLDTLLDDVRVDAVKIGMLANAGIIRAVVAAIDRYAPRHVVLDPVMVAKSGDRLLAPEAVAVLRDELLPRVDLITPNLPEAADLLGEPETTSADDMPAVAERLAALGAKQVLLKGGHLDGESSVDVLHGGGATEFLTSPRVATTNDHGTGCTLSAAIAALRPQRPDWPSAVREAKQYLTTALRESHRLDVGHGHGPVHHFHQWW
ncbi:hydroxymethylpyrimidine kinase /phosphomethylpyrimidine kinase [Saccharopolyspora erythraea NRRL 2338]|uniref:Phosphomethylpyrimidine kinase n=2 Tax=Saccharopolyspora erythraea TaxID=1836 RepID=A4F995_SACEN|nr:bifunctional hydroxymethylpyrimidine kinase/phosphomethylpyrimidine kinase [Saccharopolyspora erythraea]EQD86568.1 phosphomethylpyrimidine kinase [Saccharopolyspora erythraea D]PFG94412.1 hydroxymethylpyrimidine kinase /phosphomethylpyrimidine kinase [Saccharopolyspora erythraea NRRL 2338]QRK91172.1 bifunctional hydroxymethylpyrimidine kinase/phosphomethylpyrimidine kinase [Saccharopolyspora erythraea]CAM00620.1 phosphomethylpyrimidine kinase [Saccharopolyspora erythraea NRRL 2338]